MLIAKEGVLDREDPQLAMFLRELLENDALEGPVVGITLRAIAEGPEALTPRQHDAFETYVLERHCRKKCRLCGCIVSPDEIGMLFERDGLCSWCDYRVWSD